MRTDRRPKVGLDGSRAFALGDASQNWGLAGVSVKPEATLYGNALQSGQMRSHQRLRDPDRIAFI